MNIEKLYETIILRDILEYLAPGSIFLFGFLAFIESCGQALGINLIKIEAIFSSGSVLILFLAMSYITGHFLTGVHKHCFRNKEDKQALKVLEENNELKNNVIGYALTYSNKSVEDTAKYLKEQGDDQIERSELEKKVSYLRELARHDLAQRNQDLYLEFIARHSILSRFCQNMSLAISAFLIFLFFSGVQEWTRTDLFRDEASWINGVISSIPVFVLCWGIYIFYYRSKELRKSMIKHTFTLWCNLSED